MQSDRGSSLYTRLDMKTVFISHKQIGALLTTLHAKIRYDAVKARTVLTKQCILLCLRWGDVNCYVFLPFQALLHTRNVSAEEAAMYYFNKLENEVPIS